MVAMSAVKTAASNRRLLRLVLAIGTAIVVVVLTLSAGAASSDSAIRAVVTAGLHAQQEVGLPPLTYSSGPLSAHDQAIIRTDGEAQLRVFFAGDQLVKEKDDLASMVLEQASGTIRHLAAGVKNIKITSVEIDGDSAVVNASATVWAKFGQEQGTGKLVIAEPENDKLYTFYLERIDGSWLIVDESSEFAEGSAP